METRKNNTHDFALTLNATLINSVDVKALIANSDHKSNAVIASLNFAGIGIVH